MEVQEAYCPVCGWFS